jgi:hypothetical protein
MEKNTFTEWPLTDSKDILKYRPKEKQLGKTSNRMKLTFSVTQITGLKRPNTGKDVMKNYLNSKQFLLLKPTEFSF